MEYEVIKCQGCGMETPAGAFCVHCGAGIAPAPEPARSSEPDRLYERLVSEYSRYAAKVAEAQANRGMGGRLMSVFTGGSHLKESPIHDEFFEGVKSCVEDIMSFTESGGGRGLSGRCLRYMLLEAQDTGGDYAKWMFVAVQSLAEPLIPCLDTDTRRELYEAYRKQLKKSPGLPVQKKLLQTLKI